ncbi:ataxin-10-like [Ylistrum balloti]|uniref:ataxin-10-like n=1 Tax=Ylistrum balloti TaxID=509963 RepID=UPI002905EBE9|nr:ataxin-10-like [Ylistrum balloti]
MDTEVDDCFLAIAGVFDSLESNNHNQLLELLQKLTNKLKEANSREKIVKTHVEIIVKVLHKCDENLKEDFDERPPPEVICCITECYRTLRNACAGCRANQDLVIQSSCLECCVNTIRQCLREQTESSFLSKMDEDKIVCLQCCVQFLGNLVVGHLENSKQVWNRLSKSFRDLLFVEDTKLTQYICMVVHSCIQAGRCDQEWLTRLGADLDFQQIVCRILNVLTTTDMDWGMYVIEDAMMIKGILEVIDLQLSIKERIFALEVLLSQLRSMSDSEGPRDGVLDVCLDTLQYLSKEVVSNAYNILILASEDNQMTSTPQPEVIVKQIEALGEASSNHSHYSGLQDNPDLLTSAVYLLEAIHKLGQDSSNAFSSVKKLASDEVDTDHPVFGLRKDLVRLIGNMCFRHQRNQEQAATLNALPLILDQTNIDKKNPYITQWAILAVRNLCEGSPQNKQVLAGLKKQGLADNSTVLQELGMDAEVRDDKIYVTPSRKDQEPEG